jgi:N-acetylglucosaminyldiphosphoundecaprenol N-acetyl-beta-D-mannosaminyltransferase
MIDRGRHDVLGVHIDAVDYEAAVERVALAARERRPLAVSALAVHGVMIGVLDPVHRHRLNAFDLIVPDGQPVRWALNFLYRTRLRDRVYGPNLMLAVCERAERDGLPIFLFGATPDILASLQSALAARYPRLKIARSRPSRFRPLDPAENEELRREIQTSGAAITFVGLGCPRQEVWVYEHRQALSMPLLAVGAAFAFHAGHLAQAPAGLQSRGLEWLYRLLREPRRLWRRYLLLNPLYLILLFLQAIGWHRIAAEHNPAPAQELRYG